MEGNATEASKSCRHNRYFYKNIINTEEANLPRRHLPDGTTVSAIQAGYYLSHHSERQSSQVSGGPQPSDGKTWFSELVTGAVETSNLAILIDLTSDSSDPECRLQTRCSVLPEVMTRHQNEKIALLQSLIEHCKSTSSVPFEIIGIRSTMADLHKSEIFEPLERLAHQLKTTTQAHILIDLIESTPSSISSQSR